MKKIFLPLFCIPILIFCFTGCDLIDNLFKTSSYVSYDSFAKKHEAGMTKQEVFDKLGCPKGYYDINGNYYAVEIEEVFEANISCDQSVAWIYTCYEYSDPANLYRLRVDFDLEGKSTNTDMVAAMGG